MLRASLNKMCTCITTSDYLYISNSITGVGSGGGGACAPPPTFLIGGAIVCLCPPLLTPHFYFPLELYVYITLTLISKYNSFILLLYRRYINYVSVCPPPPTHFLAPSYATEYVCVCMHACMYVYMRVYMYVCMCMY